MSAPRPTPPASLNERRDAYARRIRAAHARLSELLPGELKGILGRAEAVLAAQFPALDRLCALHLDAVPEPAALGEVADVLMRAYHLPRMLLACGRVLLQQEKSRALGPVEEEALLLARELAVITQEWVRRNQEALGADPDEDALELDELL